MSNTFMSGLKSATNYTLTENHAVTHVSTLSGLADLFGMGGAYRSRPDEDCIMLFRKAYAEDPVYALKCLFYLRDCNSTEGQGERRFFRVVMKDLASFDTEAARRNMKNIIEYGRYDDLFCLFDTPLETEMLEFVKHQLALDVQCQTPSLLGKWMPSCNASSIKTKSMGARIRKYLGWTPRQYRKTLSVLRERINVLERLMSAGQWDKIEFDKIPSKAGLKYKNAFARHDVERAKAGAKTYEEFAKDENTKVNTKTLYPAEVVAEAVKAMKMDHWNRTQVPMDDTNRLMVNKYWDNLYDYFNGASFNGLCVCDTSGSMTCGGGSVHPIDVAISLSLYCAERAKGPFAGHYISFSSRPQLIATEGVDFCDKVRRIYETNLCENTNIEATFDLLLDTAIRNGCSQEDLPSSIVIVSDMEFDSCQDYHCRNFNQETLMEGIARKWETYGYHMPNLVFWNVDARNNNIPMELKNGISFVSGYSASLFDSIMKNVSAMDLIYDKLNSPRYKVVC